LAPGSDTLSQGVPLRCRPPLLSIFMIGAGRSPVGEVATSLADAPYAALSGFRVDHPGCVAGAFQGQIRHAVIVFEIEAPLRECSDVTAGLLEVPTVDRFDC